MSSDGAAAKLWRVQLVEHAGRMCASTARIRSTQPGGRRLRDRVVTQNEEPNVREARGCPPHLGRLSHTDERLEL